MADLFDTYAQKYFGDTGKGDGLGLPERIMKAQAIQQTLQRFPELLDTDKAFKDAQTENYLAMARGLGHYAKGGDADEKYAEKIAKADALKKAQQFAMAIPKLSRYNSNFSEDPQQGAQQFRQFQDELGSLPPELQAFFGTKDNMQLSQDLLGQAMEYAQGMHPELNRILRTEKTQQGQTDRNTANNERMKQIAQMQKEQRENLAKIKQSGQKESMENQAARFKEAARTADTPEEKSAYYELYVEAMDAAERLKAAPAVAGPDAKRKNTMKMLDDFNERNAGGNRANKLTEPKTISVEDMRKGL